MKNIEQPKRFMEQPLTVVADRSELKALLRRACNTLAPEQTPTFVQPLFDALESGIPVLMTVIDAS